MEWANELHSMRSRSILGYIWRNIIDELQPMRGRDLLGE
jgi:hypothetical protein